MPLSIRSCLILIFLFVIFLTFLLSFLSKYTNLDVNIINTSPLLSPQYLSHGFNITNPGDVIVFLHMQKTGGSYFDGELVSNIVDHSCPGQLIKLRNKQEPVWRNHKCYKPLSVENWIFTRRTVGWPCGVHSDYTSLKFCAPKYLSSSLGYAKWSLFFITNLRHPVSRFVSEYLHVKRGAKWPVYPVDCSLSNTTFIPGVFLRTVRPQCELFGNDRGSISIEEFLGCKQNPAINRMTHMLAGYDTSECPPNSHLSTRELERIVLQTAKYNLETMAYFGILEYIQESSQLFENTFSVKFVEYPEFRDSSSGSVTLTSQQLEAIQAANHLDLDLYNWAVPLFKDRIANLRVD